MMTLREKRATEANNNLTRTMAQRDGCIASLIRYELRIKDLRRKVARLAKPAPEPKPAPMPEPVAVPQVIAQVAHSDGSTSNITTEDVGIPAFLRRTPPTTKRDAEALAEIEATKAERKKRKTDARIAKMKAKDRGDLRRMPLTGRAALEAIRNG